MSYPDYRTFLRYKNCCRPIGDTGPPGPAGPTGPAATIDISGSKGEILYFSETDNLVSTDNVFIQEANVTINNNLVVTGTTYLNNTLDVSGNTTIQNGILKVLNPNDKNFSQFQTSQGSIYIGASNNTRFGDVSYNLIFSTGGSDNNGLAIGTLSDTEPLIFGVDNTEVIRITDNGDQRVGIKTSNPSATLEVSGNVIINGNLSMSDQFINDVSGIFFSDGTYIGHGTSFDITTSERLDISAAAGVTVNGNLTVNDATTFNKTFHVIGNTTLENLFVNGSINNLIEISGNTIQPIISESVNLGYDESGSSNDKRFNLGFFNKIKTRTAIIVGNLIMDESSITNVDNISSVNNLTIQGSDGVTIRGNLTVDDATTFNNTLDVSGATTIRSNLSMDDNFINDVSGIYFTDGTYIGHGSSFDITTSETLDISASGGINLNTDVTINSDITINSNLTANTIHTQRLLFPAGNYIDYQEGIGELYVNGNTTLAHRVQIFSTLDVSGATTIRSNLSMDNNFINDVSGIYFSDGTYIQDKHGELRIQSSDGLNISTGILGTNHYGKFTIQNNNNLRFNNDNTYITSNIADDKLRLYGNSIFMEAGVNGNFTFTGNSNNVDLNFLTQSASSFNINYKHSDNKLRFNVDDLVIDASNNFIGIQTDSPSATLDVNGNAIINGNLSMNNNFINHVSGIYFTQGNLLFSDFSSVNQSVQLPSSQGQPISLERKTLFYDENFNVNTGGYPIDISFVDATFNQLGLTISGSGNTIISPSPDISGQYVEIYANFLINSANGNSKTIALDISGVSSGSLFNETIDVRSISKRGTYYITFGPHIFTPEQWADTSEFVITANTTDSLNINKYKLMFKSYFM